MPHTSPSSFVPAVGRSHCAALLLTAILLAFSSSAHGATLVERGDVLRVELPSAPELSREAPVDADGRIALPLLGSMPVEGLDTDTIGKQIAAAFEERALLKSPVVLVEVATYRQVYVGGSVGRPGAIDFVPGMSARQAVIAAGGIRLLPVESTAQPDNVLAALAARPAKVFRLTLVDARIARLEAELAGKDALMDTGEPTTGIAPSVKRMLTRTEAELLSQLNKQTGDRETHTRELLKLIALEIDTLKRQADLQQSEADVQQAEIDDARTLVNKGLMPRPRLQEMLREQSQLSRDQLDTHAYTARAQQQATTVRYQLQDEATQRREAVLQDLQTARAEQAQLQGEIQALDLQIVAGGLATPEAAETKIVVHRTTRGKHTLIDASLDDPVGPGDVIEVSIAAPAAQDGTTGAVPSAAPSDLSLNLPETRP